MGSVVVAGLRNLGPVQIRQYAHGYSISRNRQAIACTFVTVLGLLTVN